MERGAAVGPGDLQSLNALLAGNLKTLLSSFLCSREPGHLLDCGATVGPGSLLGLSHPLGGKFKNFTVVFAL